MTPSSSSEVERLIEDWRAAINVGRNRDDIVTLGGRLASALSAQSARLRCCEEALADLANSDWSADTMREVATYALKDPT